ncbi:hypothetical protein THAOC_07344 [Thalassiosira oceanica]|uniref:Uncharacterized protein n=2 Tax=Thalassiosira oceanica TaxID=159749 RepID=K0T272_THAOC|nr:hypothetical protein THAOC_07344 [Thalassiosira oceanica]|eukprot:EJK71239.1 hypothetical protein THAOC_07344 [Thalassiosira oceanica]
MEMWAIEEESSPPRIEGGPGGGASTRAASGARRASTAADEAPDPCYDDNDDPMMTAVQWTNDLSLDDTDDAAGPPALPMSTMVGSQGRRSRLAVDVGNISALSRCRVADENSNTTPPHFGRQLLAQERRRRRTHKLHKLTTNKQSRTIKFEEADPSKKGSIVE